MLLTNPSFVAVFILGSAGANPWSLHCHKEELDKMRALGSSSKAHSILFLHLTKQSMGLLVGNLIGLVI